LQRVGDAVVTLWETLQILQKWVTPNCIAYRPFLIDATGTRRYACPPAACSRQADYHQSGLIQAGPL